MIFGMLNLAKIWHEILQICPPHLSDVASSPCVTRRQCLQKTCVQQLENVKSHVFCILKKNVKQLKNVSSFRDHSIGSAWVSDSFSTAQQHIIYSVDHSVPFRRIDD